jgi:hypothetical protein
LYFDLSIGNDVWVGDVFTLSVDDDWQISSTPTCESVVATGVTNLFVSPAGNNVLDCLASDRTVYIYGIA